MGTTYRKLLIWLLAFLTGYAVYDVVRESSGEVAFSDFLADVDAGKLTDVEVKIDDGTFTWSSGDAELVAEGELTDGVMERMRRQGVRFSVVHTDVAEIIIRWLPLAMVAAVVLFFAARRRGWIVFHASLDDLRSAAQEGRLAKGVVKLIPPQVTWRDGGVHKTAVGELDAELRILLEKAGVNVLDLGSGETETSAGED